MDVSGVRKLLVNQNFLVQHFDEDGALSLL